MFCLQTVPAEYIFTAAGVRHFRRVRSLLLRSARNLYKGQKTGHRSCRVCLSAVWLVGECCLGMLLFYMGLICGGENDGETEGS